MTTFIIRRTLASAVTLLVVAVVVFALSRMIGNPVNMYLDPSATADDRELVGAARADDAATAARRPGSGSRGGARSPLRSRSALTWTRASCARSWRWPKS